MKRYMYLAVAVAMAFTAAVAQGPNGQGRGRGSGQNSERRAEMRSWFEATVLPSLREWHKEYDASLSAEDLATLTTLRAKAKQLRDSRRTGDRDQIHDEMMALAKEARPILKRSRDKIFEILDRNEAQIDAWRDKARSMMGMLDGGRKTLMHFVLWDGGALPEPGMGQRNMKVAPNPSSSTTR